MTDFRALCQELMDAIDSGIPVERIKQSPLAVRVDALLAQPEPQGPTDERLTWLWNHLQVSRRQLMALRGENCLDDTDYQQFARSVLKQWGRPAIEPVPKREDVHYAWELHDAEGEWQAGGSANSVDDVQREGKRYLQTYSQHGLYKLIIQQHRVTTIEPAPQEEVQ